MTLPGVLLSDLKTIITAAAEPDSRQIQLQFKVLGRAIMELNSQISILQQQVAAIGNHINSLSRELATVKNSRDNSPEK